MIHVSLSAFFFILLIAGPVFAAVDAVEKAREKLDEGQFSEALDAVNDLLERRPANVKALKIRALAESGLGRYDNAIADYERVLNKNPDDVEAHRELGLLLAFKAKDGRHALLHLDRYLSLKADGLDSSEVGRTVKLMRSLDASHTLSEKRAIRDLEKMAQSFERGGKPRLAGQTYERILQISPTDSRSHEALGRLMAKERRKSKECASHRIKARLFDRGGQYFVQTF